VDGWLKSVFGGLSSYGMPVTFSESKDLPGAAGSLAIRIDLQLAAVADVQANKTANVQVAVATITDGQEIRKSYRGMAAVTNWNSGDGELQRLVDRAFADALGRLRAI
jgi:hypothetical protein